MKHRSKVMPKWTKNQRKIYQKSIKNLSKICQNRSWGVLGRLGRVLVHLGGLLKASWAVWSRKRWPTWLQLGSQNGAEIEKKSKQKSIKILMPLGVRFFQDFGGFWRQNGAKLAPKSHQKSIPTSKGDVLKKPYFSLGKTLILKVLGVQVGTKNRSKIDQKMKSSWEGILASIFHEFLWILEAKLAPSWVENRSKINQKLPDAPSSSQKQPEARKIDF